MIIRKMTAVFGTLEGETLELREDINVISAPNESGKSTWCAFIRAMLYGIDSAQREKNGIKPDKLKYAPFSGMPMGGEMELEWEGRSITLSRHTSSPNAPMRVFEAKYTGTNEDVPGLSGADAGLILTGMTREVFDRSVFVRQSGIAVDSAPELEKRISATVSSGEVGVSYTEADEWLKKSLRRRAYNKKGAIPELDSEIANIKGSIESLREDTAQRSALENELAAALDRKSRHQVAARDSRDADRLRSSGEIQALRVEVGELEEKYLSARESFAEKRAGAEACVFGSRVPEEIMMELEADFAKGPDEKSAIFRFFPAFVALAAALSVAGVLLAPLLVAAAGFWVLALVSGLSRNKTKAARTKFENDMIQKYGTDDRSAAEELVSRHAEVQKELAAAQAALRDLQNAMNEAKRCLTAAEQDFIVTGAAAQGEAETQYDAEIDDLRRKIAMIDGRFSSLGDPMVLQTRLSLLEAGRSRLQGQYNAISLAIETLLEANGEMQAQFSPRLGALASDIMFRITGGKYEKLLFDRAFNASARPSGRTRDFEAGFLSAGTLDQLYLSLRLAICDIALPEGYSCPLILDDALCNFDDERMAMALDYLEGIALERQVILFTCHERETRYLAGKPRTSPR